MGKHNSSVLDGQNALGAASPLGNITKNEATALNRGFQVNHLTGEIVESEPTAKLARAERFALQATARDVLGKEHRTWKCMARKAPKQQIEIVKSNAHGRASYKGLYVCARLWTCPVCAAKISERRRVELVQALDTASRQGLQVKLLTLTVPHGIGDDVKALLSAIKNAWRRTSTGRAGKALRKLLGVSGTVRALEVTYGQNGFHPHLHVLLFLEKQASNDAVQCLFGPLWQDACTKAGLPRPSDAHGCRVDDGSKAATYASKWGLESEMTKSHSKRGKAGGMTPWDFLRAMLADEDDAAKCRALFRIYAEAFHGERQLHWSIGLKALLEVGEATDEELAIADQDSCHTLAKLVSSEWRAIMHARAQAAVLDAAEERPDQLAALVAALYARHRAYLQRRRTD